MAIRLRARSPTIHHCSEYDENFSKPSQHIAYVDQLGIERFVNPPLVSQKMLDNTVGFCFHILKIVSHIVRIKSDHTLKENFS